MTMCTIANESSVPWYRQGWPWFLLSIPATSIVLGMGMLYLALHTNNSLVVDDYYKEGKSINQRIERDRAAALLGLNASIMPTTDGINLRINVVQPDIPEHLWKQALVEQKKFILPDTISVQWVHATQAEKDVTALFEIQKSGLYFSSDTSMPDSGHWRIHILPIDNAHWRLVSEMQALSNTSTVFVKSPALDTVFATTNRGINNVEQVAL